MTVSRLVKTVVPTILATRPEYPFGGNIFKSSAFLIQRPSERGNVWVYSSSHTGEYVDHVAELGGVTHQLLNHRDEASKFSNVLSAPVFCHALEKDAVEGNGAIVSETYEGNEHKFGDDLIAYHTPGHARGVTSYFYKDGDDGVSVLFTGDTLYANDEGRILRGPLEYHPYQGNREDMIKTLSFYIELNPTYIISGLTSSNFWVEFKADAVRKLIDVLKSSSS
jgi:hypothetical protein